jgi:hypothetical protein
MPGVRSRCGARSTRSRRTLTLRRELCRLTLLGAKVGLVAYDNNKDPLDSLGGVCG